jgi:hypothetical protein
MMKMMSDTTTPLVENATVLPTLGEVITFWTKMMTETTKTLVESAKVLPNIGKIIIFWIKNNEEHDFDKDDFGRKRNGAAKPG